jgi:polyribonucleotide nucleotidyltransferase
VLPTDGVRIELTLRSGEVAAGSLSIADFHEGQLTQGKVCCPLGSGLAWFLQQGLRRAVSTGNAHTNLHTHAQLHPQVFRVEPYGVFVQLARSAVRGLAHISHIDKPFVSELAKHYSPGQVVSVRCVWLACWLARG